MSIRPYPFCALILTVVAVPMFSQEIQKLDPALDKIVGPDSKLERVATGFNKWTEGPVWTREGILLFAEIPANNIIQWTPGKGASVFIHPSGYEGSEPYKGPEPGSNGMTLDADGRVSVAGHARRNVWRMESVDPKAQITILADSYQGKKLNSPNDLVYKSDGSLYFTDPPYGLQTQGDDDPQKAGRMIHGVPVVGSFAEFPRLLANSGVQVVVASTNKIEPERWAIICRPTCFSTRYVPVRWTSMMRCQTSSSRSVRRLSSVLTK